MGCAITVYGLLAHCTTHLLPAVTHGKCGMVRTYLFITCLSCIHWPGQWFLAMWLVFGVGEHWLSQFLTPLRQNNA